MTCHMSYSWHKTRAPLCTHSFREATQMLALCERRHGTVSTSSGESFTKNPLIVDQVVSQKDPTDLVSF